MVRYLLQLESFDPSGLPKCYERYAAPKQEDHGSFGPIHNSLPKNPLPGIGTFIDGCEEAGIPKALDTNTGHNVGSSFRVVNCRARQESMTDDHYVSRQIGAGLVQMAIYKGARVSSATQLLNDEGDIGAGLRRPKNLEIRVETRVEKIIFDRKRAIGVQVEGGKKCEI